MGVNSGRQWKINSHPKDKNKSIYLLGNISPKMEFYYFKLNYYMHELYHVENFLGQISKERYTTQAKNCVDTKDKNKK